MAIKANASSQGGEGFKRFVGVASFRVLGVNPTKEEFEKFLGRSMQSEPKPYLSDAVDEKDNNKPYKKLRVTFLIQADAPEEIDPKNKASRECNANLTEPFKTTISFFLDSRYCFSHKDGIDKVQVIDKYARTAWVTIEQCKNHQIPVYKNGPAKLDSDYRPTYRGEEELTNFILNYLNVTPIETYNNNTGQWITNPNPEDCEGQLAEIKKYFTGDISELKEFCTYMPDNRLKLLVGLKPDDEGKLFTNVYTRITARNGAKSYTRFKDKIDGDNKYLTNNGKSPDNTIWSNDPLGVIGIIAEYKDDVKETDLSKSNVEEEDPFKQAAALPEAGSDLPFGETTDEDPFANMA